jgi:hypothetical protein
VGIERPLPAADEDVLAGRRDGISMSDDSDQLKPRFGSGSRVSLLPRTTSTVSWVSESA